MLKILRMFIFILIFNILPSTPLFATCSDLFSEHHSIMVEGIKYIMSHSDFFSSIYSSKLSKEEIEKQLIQSYSLTLDDIARILIQKRNLPANEYQDYIRSQLGVDLKEENLEINITLPVVAPKEIFTSLGFSDEDLHIFPSSDLASDIIEADDIIPINEIYYKLKVGKKFALVKLINSKFFILTDPLYDEIDPISSVFFSVSLDNQKYLLICNNKFEKDISLLEYDSTSPLTSNFLLVTHNGKRMVVAHMYTQYNNEPLQTYDAVVLIDESVQLTPIIHGSRHLLSFEKHQISVIIDPFYSIRDCFDRVRKLASSTSGFRSQLTDSDAIYISSNSKGSELIYTSSDTNTKNEILHHSFGTFDSIRPIIGVDHKIDFFIVSKNYRYDILDVNSLLDPTHPLELDFPYTSITYLPNETTISSKNKDYISVSFLVSSLTEGTKTIKVKHIRNFIKNRY